MMTLKENVSVHCVLANPYHVPQYIFVTLNAHKILPNDLAEGEKVRVETTWEEGAMGPKSSR